jgi:hypothetical protein
VRARGLVAAAAACAARADWCRSRTGRSAISPLKLREGDVPRRSKR